MDSFERNENINFLVSGDFTKKLEHIINIIFDFCFQIPLNPAHWTFNASKISMQHACVMPPRFKCCLNVMSGKHGSRSSSMKL